MVRIGDIAPDFETVTESGEKFKPSDNRGKNVMVYFYPKDNSSGCKAEACSIGDSYSIFTEMNIRVAGNLGGSVKSHLSFKGKNNLPFPLLMDEDFKIAKIYGVYQKKKMYGKEYMGIVRITFFIDGEGKVERIFGGADGIEKVKTKEHADQVIKFWKLKL